MTKTFYSIMIAYQFTTHFLCFAEIAITIQIHTIYLCAIMLEITLNITLHGSNYNRSQRHFIP